MKGLYIHIPFCRTICSYCDFKKQVPYKNIEELYINALIKEIEDKKDQLNDINTVYIGGGTPNSLSIEQLEALLKVIKPYLDKSIESSIELNPELVTEEYAILLAKYKINRVSLGVQTINEDLIKLLNRHHNIAIVKNAYSILNKYIKNINLDLMFGIPNEAISDIKNDLALVEELKPTHISYYSLILEPKTILSYKHDKGELKLLDDDLIADMNDYINVELKRMGYKHYETSNYAIEGFESKHNLIYWNLEEYIGVGLAACSLYKNERLENTSRLKDYLDGAKPYIEELSKEEFRNEFMFLGLRKLEGISLDRYKVLFDGNPIDDYHLNDLVEKGILLIENGKLKIEENHIFVSNQVLVRFVGDNID